MQTDLSWSVVSRVPGLPFGMRRGSNAVTKGLLAALAAGLLSFGASAYAVDGPYVGVGGSLSILNDANVTSSGGGYQPLDVSATTSNGFAVRGLGGYAFSNGLRVEAELDYRRHGTDAMNVRSPGALVELGAQQFAAASGLPPGTTYADLPPEVQAGIAAAATGPQSIDGAFSMLAFMANVDYDFDTGSRWVPYIGGGLGAAIISLDAETAAGGASLVDDSATVFAYQVGAGLGYEFPLAEGRSVTVSLDWRYFGTQTPTFTGDVAGNEFDVGISGHDLGIGVIYGF